MWVGVASAIQSYGKGAEVRLCSKESDSNRNELSSILHIVYNILMINKEKRRVNGTIYMNKRRNATRNFVNKIKENPCADCKNSFHPCQMEFDHLPGTKKIKTINKLANSGAALIHLKNELSKCELVCSNCHALRTFLRLKGKTRDGLTSP